jgi:hypothetical protein
VLRFFAPDNFGGHYDVKVNLASADAGIQLCVYRHDTGSHSQECVLENDSCGRSFDHNGGFFGDDSADYVVKISRTPGSAPTCQTYAVTVENG